METSQRSASKPTLRALDWLNFFLADVQTGLGPFLAIYLSDLGWSARSVGTVLTVGGLAGIASPIPVGNAIDTSVRKRHLVAAAVACVALGSLVIALAPTFIPILSAEILMGATSSIFGPAVTAISLGLVGAKSFAHRQGRNQMFNSVGNVFTALLMGCVAFIVSDRATFLFSACLTIPALYCLKAIDPHEINDSVARNASHEKNTKIESIGHY